MAENKKKKVTSRFTNTEVKAEYLETNKNSCLEQENEYNNR